MYVYYPSLWIREYWIKKLNELLSSDETDNKNN